MNRKVIFIDYDGTLYSHEKNLIPINTIKILKEIQTENKIDVFLSTGRTIVYLKTQPDTMKLFNGLISANGQYVVFNNKVIYENYINTSLVVSFVKYCQINKISISLYSKDIMYLLFFNPIAHDNMLKKNPKLMYKDITIIDELIDKQIHQICLFCDNNTIDQITKFFPKLNILKWGKEGADVIGLDSSKGLAVKRIIKEGNYDLKNTYAIGNGDNDIPMFNEVNNAIAMGNSSEFVKTHANYIVKDINNDGLYEILCKIKNDEI